MPSSHETSPTSGHPSKISHEDYYQKLDRMLATRYVRMQMKRREALRSPTPGKFVPRMDLYDDEALPRITAILEIPGVARGGFTVQVQNNVLVVQGDRGSPMVARLIRPAIPSPTSNTIGSVAQNAGLSTTSALSPEKFRVRDLRFGRFRREIPLPEGTKSKDVVAELTDGLLFLSWPRYPTPDLMETGVAQHRQT